jgi:hypothetical protein
VAAPTVPDLMFGCWRRSWIKYDDGKFDDTSTVVWLQTESQMVDVRINGDRPDMANRSGLSECSVDELRAIAASDASSGFTKCGPAVIGADGLRSATATWNTRGFGVNFQPVSAFPEPGLMSWNDDATVMTERAPSGAYVEEWRLVPGSRDSLSVAHDGVVATYRAGDVAVLVRDRAVPVPRLARLSELVDEYASDRALLEEILDCEFSVAERSGDRWTITTSTLPWRQGEVINVDEG